MKKLGVQSWEEISDGKFINFLMFSPYVDYEVQREAVSRIPDFPRLASEAFTSLIEKGKELNKEDRRTYELLEHMLDEIRKNVNRKSLSEEDIRSMIDRIKVIASMIIEIQKEKLSSRNYYLTWVAAIGGVSAAVTAMIWGIISLVKRRKK